jgi:hypothetical protein
MVAVSLVLRCGAVRCGPTIHKSVLNDLVHSPCGRISAREAREGGACEAVEKTIAESRPNVRARSGAAFSLHGGTKRNPRQPEKETQMNLENTISTRQMAARLGMSKKAVYTFVTNGAPVIRLKNNRFRFEPEKFDAWLLDTGETMVDAKYGDGAYRDAYTKAEIMAELIKLLPDADPKLKKMAEENIGELIGMGMGVILERESAKAVQS